MNHLHSIAMSEMLVFGMFNTGRPCHLPGRMVYGASTTAVSSRLGGESVTGNSSNKLLHLWNQVYLILFMYCLQIYFRSFQITVYVAPRKSERLWRGNVTATVRFLKTSFGSFRTNCNLERVLDAILPLFAVLLRSGWGEKQWNSQEKWSGGQENWGSQNDKWAQKDNSNWNSQARGF